VASEILAHSAAFHFRLTCWHRPALLAGLISDLMSVSVCVGVCVYQVLYPYGNLSLQCEVMGTVARCGDIFLVPMREIVIFGLVVKSVMIRVRVRMMVKVGL